MALRARARRFVSACLTLALLLFAMPQAVRAQSDSGQITITVLDANDKKPLSMTRVLLDGPVITSEYSGDNGSVKFTDVPSGVYRARIFRRGYQTLTSDQFEVLNGRAVSVDVSLAPQAQLKEIASVTVKSSAKISTSSIGDTSAQRRLSDTLTDALNKISGVNVNTSSNDADATQTVSLEGHDASQTQLTLDGVPLNAPGSAGNLSAINSDLFRGASASFGPQAGSLGGGVNFTTLQPTLSWQGSISASVGTYGKSFYSFDETGTAGKVGIALMHTSRDTPSLADGMRYLDASGLDYVHSAQTDNGGNLLRLRYRLGQSQTLTGTYIESDSSSGLLCLQITGPIPCGYGPDNDFGQHFTLYSLTDSALIGQTAVQASIYQNAVSYSRDLLNRYVAGLLDPTGSDSNQVSNGFTLSATLPSRQRSTLSIAATGTQSSTQVSPLIASAQPYASGSQSVRFGTLQLIDTIHSNTKLRVNGHIGLSTSNAQSASLLAGVGAQWSPTSSDTWTASYDVGNSAPYPGRVGVLSDPNSLRVDCFGDVAYGTAPGDAPTASSSNSERLGYSHTWRQGVFNAQVYRQVQNGVTLPTQVNGTALGPIFPPGYFPTVQQSFDTLCGTGASIGPQNLYFSAPIAGVQRIYQGAQLAAYFNLGRLNVQPFYNIQVAQAVSNDPRFNNPYSIVISGAQLPNVPLHRAGLTLDYKAPHSIFEELLTAQYTGANNSQNLPANTVVDAGVNAHLQRGDLTVAFNNIFNTYGGVFASNQWAVPYVTQGGEQIATIARPNSPRQMTVTYTVAFGSNASLLNAQAPPLAQNVGGNEGRGGGPGGGGAFIGGPGAGGGARRFAITPLPSAPPDNPFALASGEQCSPDAAKVAQPVLDQLKAYVAKIEASKTANGYPDSVPGAPQLPGVTVVYRKFAGTYALSIEVQRRVASTQQVFGCTTVHMAQPDDVKSRGLYQPASSLFFRPSLEFMPSVGFYFVRPTPTPGQQSFRMYRLPASAPSDPFALHAGDACTAEMQPTAKRLLTELSAYFKAGTPAPDWTITPHSAVGGPWYELSNDDVTALPSLLSCGRVAAATNDELKAASFDGVRPPELNYAPKLGLYLVRNNPQGGASPPPPAKSSP